jgi:hypothetical protein
VIDIGHSVSPENENRINYSNKVAPEPTVFFEKENNSPPPPYPGQSARFCSSCEQSINKY